MDPHINSETGEVISSGRSSRFSLWTAFLVFSVVVLISSFQVVSFFFPNNRRIAENMFLSTLPRSFSLSEKS
jgi:hypothetical protein